MKKQICPCCGQSVMKHKHTLSKSLGNMLIKAYNKFCVYMPFHLQKDLELTKNQYNNFQKLRYWGAVSKHVDENGKRIGGLWVVTYVGQEIVRGTKFPKSLMTFNNEVVDQSDECICLQEAVGYYSLPEQYAEEAQPMLF